MDGLLEPGTVSEHAARRLGASVLVVLAGAAAGCGTERASLPDLHPQRGEPTQRLSYPRAGMTLRVPRSVSVTARRAPGVFKATAAQWLVSAFAYRRREQLPRDGRELEQARRRLVAETRRRDRRYRLIRSRTTRVAGARAIELLGDQTISRARMRFRSIHLFRGGAEYVIELAAPPREANDARRRFLEPVLRSLRVTGRIRR